MTIRNLEKAFRPQSIALIGATDRPGSVGATVMANLSAGGFAGPVWYVNPKYVTLGGSVCFGEISDLPGVPDLAVIVTPPQTIPRIIDDLGRGGTRAALVITAGVDEATGLKQKMLDAARPHLLRILGPNSLGMFAPIAGVNASFAHVTPHKGKLAFLSQSGAVAGALLDWAQSRQVGFSYVVSMGDMADVDFGDMLDYLAGDIDTNAILLYMEGITNPKKFLSAARSAARAKPVIAIKAGRSAAAAKAASTHTGALAGADDVIDAVLRRAGVLRVRTLEDLFDAAETLTRLKPFEAGGLTVLTNGGGAGVLAVDALSDLGEDLKPLSPRLVKQLDAFLPATWSRSNPIDIIGDAGPDRYEKALDTLLEDPETGPILIMNCPTAFSSSTSASEGVMRAITRHGEGGRLPKPIFTNWLGADTPREARARFAAAGIPTYESPEDAVRGFHYLRQYRRAQAALMQTPHDLPRSFHPERGNAAVVFAQVAAQNRTMLTAREANAVLKAYRVPCTEIEAASTAEYTANIAAKLLMSADALVLKILSRDISHKSDVGGVALGLKSPAEVREAAQRMLERAKVLRPDAVVQGFMLQEMVRRPHAHELILGIANDPTFGPIVVFGAGGTAVEVIEDKAIGLPPLDLKLARDLIAATRISKLLQGYRDRAAADLNAIALALVQLSHLIIDNPCIEELDINPLLADAEGVIALDARIKINPAWATHRAPNPRLAIRPYPRNWKKSVTTQANRSIFLRPVQPEDEKAYCDFLSDVTPEDIRNRFFGPKKAFSHEFVARLTQIDYAREMAFLAVDPASDAILGASRLVAEPNYEKAEYAILVRSALKGQGIGWALMQHLIDYARTERLQTLHGDILAENSGMLTMCRELGFDVKPSSDDPGAYRVIFKLRTADCDT